MPVKYDYETASGVKVNIKFSNVFKRLKNHFWEGGRPVPTSRYMPLPLIRNVPLVSTYCINKLTFDCYAHNTVG